MSTLHPQWPIEDQVRKPALVDFDELFDIHPALLREVAAAVPTAGDLVSRRAKFLALREWIMLASAFAIPCYACRHASGARDADPLWFKLRERWVGEEHMETGLFPRNGAVPGNTETYEPLFDPLLRWHTNLFLLRIERAFQCWWRCSPEGIVALLRPNTQPERLADVSDGVLGQDPDERAKCVATNTFPYRGRSTALGRLYLYLPSEKLVGWRRARQEAGDMDRQTTDASGRELARRL